MNNRLTVLTLSLCLCFSPALSRIALAGGYDSTTDVNNFMANGVPVMTLTRSTMNANFLGSVTVDGAVTSTGVLSAPAGINVNNNGILYANGAATFADKVGIGTTSPQSKLDIWLNNDIVSVTRTDTAANLRLQYKPTDAAGNVTSVSAGDELGRFSFTGWGQTKWAHSTGYPTRISAIAAEKFTDGTDGSDLAFYTTPLGTNVSQEAMRISHNGNVGIGTANPLAALDVWPSAANFAQAGGGIWINGSEPEGDTHKRLGIFTDSSQGNWNSLTQAGDNIILGAVLDN